MRLVFQNARAYYPGTYIYVWRFLCVCVCVRVYVCLYVHATLNSSLYLMIQHWPPLSLLTETEGKPVREAAEIMSNVFESLWAKALDSLTPTASWLSHVAPSPTTLNSLLHCFNWFSVCVCVCVCVCVSFSIDCVDKHRHTACEAHASATELHTLEPWDD
jgi:hypothetical protein